MDRANWRPVLRLPGDIFSLALWFGLAGGLAEGATFLGLQSAGLLTWPRQIVPIDANILWAATVMDCLLFAVVAVLLLPVILLSNRIGWESILPGLFAVGALHPLFSVSGHLREMASVALAVGLGAVVWRWMRKDAQGGLRFFRQTLIPLSLAAVLVCGGAILWPMAREWLAVRRLPDPPPEAPNVLWIVLDTLRADRIGAYGYPRPTTPFLDRFARQAVLFENAFSNSSWTLPSHGSMFTGRVPSEHGAILFPRELPFPTVAERLSQRGYVTAGFVSNNGALSRPFGLPRGFQRWENMFFGSLEAASRTMYGRKIRQYVLRGVEHHPHLERMGAPEVNRRFLRWIDSQPRRPFLAYLNYMEMHRAYVPPFEYARRFSSEPEKIVRRDEPLVWRKSSESLEKQQETWSDAYDSVLAYLDSQLELLFGELERRGLNDKTIIIITSDHGESLGEHGLYTHRHSLYIEQIRVPLLIRLAGRTPEGVRVPFVSGLDRLPATIFDLAGLGTDVFPTVSLAGSWLGQGSAGDGVVSEVSGGSWTGVPKQWPIHQGSLQSFISEQYHLLVPENAPVELYDWRTDPREENNLAADPQFAELISEMRARLPKPSLAVPAIQ